MRVLRSETIADGTIKREVVRSDEPPPAELITAVSVFAFDDDKLLHPDNYMLSYVGWVSAREDVSPDGETNGSLFVTPDEARELPNIQRNIELFEESLQAIKTLDPRFRST